MLQHKTGIFSRQGFPEESGNLLHRQREGGIRPGLIAGSVSHAQGEEEVVRLHGEKGIHIVQGLLSGGMPVRNDGVQNGFLHGKPVLFYFLL